MKITDFDIHEGFIPYVDLWDKFGSGYCDLYNWLSVVCKRENKKLTSHGVPVELIEEYLVTYKM